MRTELTAHDKTYIERRRDSALWYAFGREDESGQNVDCLAFSHYAEDEATNYRLEKVSSLASVQDQYETWKALQ